jgi:hypothetical protein
MDERWSHLVQDPAVLLESAMCYTVGDGTYQEQGAMLERQFHMVVCLPTSVGSRMIMLWADCRSRDRFCVPQRPTLQCSSTHLLQPKTEAASRRR